MGIEIGAFIPQQSRSGENYTLRSPNIHAAALECAQNRLFVWDNGPVFALPGNANDPYLSDKVRIIKQERGGDQPLGWTVPFSHSLDLVDKDQIGGDDIRKFMDNPDVATAHQGGITFFRLPADKRRKAERNIPDVVIPDAPDAMVQVYSPNGNDVTHAFVRSAMALGAEPVMTSANPSGSPEYIYAWQAQRFADEVGVELFINWPDGHKPETPRGSYPILGSTTPKEIMPGDRGAFKLLREGCFGIDVLRRLLDGYVVVEAPDMKKSKYPDHSMTMEDIGTIAEEVNDFAELPKLRGPEFRLGLLAVMRWQYHHWEAQKARGIRNSRLL